MKAKLKELKRKTFHKKMYITAFLLVFVIHTCYAVSIKPTWTALSGDKLNLVSITSDGKYVVVLNGHHDIYLFDNNGNQLWHHKINLRVRQVEISSNGDYILAFCFEKKFPYYDIIYLFDNSGKLLWKRKVCFGGSVDFAVASCDGKYIAVVAGTKKMFLFDNHGKLLWEYNPGQIGELGSVIISRDDKYVVIGGKNLSVFSINGSLIWSYKTNGSINSYADLGLGFKGKSDSFSITNSLIAMSSDDRYIVTGCKLLKNTGFYNMKIPSDSEIYMFNNAGKLLWKRKVNSWIEVLAMDSMGKHIAVLTTNSKIYMFNNAGKLLWNYTMPMLSGCYMKISSDGKYLVTTGGGSVYVFNSNGSLLWSYKARLFSVDISSHGRYIVAGNWALNGNYSGVYMFNNAVNSANLTKTPTKNGNKKQLNNKNNFILSILTQILYYIKHFFQL